jgi:predicted alpha-1,6-mannanase (GH76 family)
LINSDNLINDGLELDCTNSGTRTIWSYNQGVILGGLVELNKAAADSSLIDTANSIANAAITNLTDSNHIIHDVCEPNCAPDGTQFKGIFMRNLAALQAVSPSDTYTTVIQANADSIWNNDRDTSTNQLSDDWAGPFDSPANASTHSSAMDALIAAIPLG